MKHLLLDIRLRFVILSILLFQYAFLNAQAPKEIQIQKDCQKIHASWLEEVLVLTKITVGNSAPVAARNLMYVNVALYEAALLILPQNQSLSGQLSNFERTVWPNEQSILNPLLVQEVVAYQMIIFLYKNMPPSNRKRIDELYELALLKHNKKGAFEDQNPSVKFGESLALEIIEWSKKDGGNEAYAKNFPKDYFPPKCDSCWRATYPGYVNAMQPYWGKNTLMISSSATVSLDIPIIGFSLDSNAIIFKDALQMYQSSQDSTKGKWYKYIAEYWNDAPGYSGTPSGHFFALALQLSTERKLDFKTSCELFACLGIAINDANIETFRLKYKYNLLRPISYINDYIGRDFNTIIDTPPFPEFPSGHSYQSGSGSEILKAFLGDDFAFKDLTNKDRVDIDGTPRTFKNLTEMSEEISLSRYYGGIHFMYTLNTSLAYGRKLGINTLSKLQFEP